MKKITPKEATSVEPKESAQAASLSYMQDTKPGITRKLKGKHFAYYDVKGKLIKDDQEIDRINKLAIPPAYKDVWISPSSNSHLQATGRDDRGRKQYRYHPKWKAVRDETKYTKMVAFGEALPKIRKKIKEDLELKGLPKDKILSAIVHLMQITLIRVGNEEYARENGSYGITTLQDKHAKIKGSEITFSFKAKSNKNVNVCLDDPRLAKIVRKCQDLPGQDLFAYVDEEGKVVPINSTDVNEYLQNITEDHFTAKDFRTWAGTLLAYLILQSYPPYDSEGQGKKIINEVIVQVADKLKNTPAVCRKSYINPLIFDSYLSKKLKYKKRAKVKLGINLFDLGSIETEVLEFLKKNL